MTFLGSAETSLASCFQWGRHDLGAERLWAVLYESFMWVSLTRRSDALEMHLNGPFVLPANLLTNKMIECILIQ